MKNNIYSLFLASAAIMAFSGCEKENAFKFIAEEGQLNCSTLTVDYINSGTRASDVDTGDFMVNFVKKDSEEVVKSYKYSELPEIVSLPAGNYHADASYGEDKEAEWENPVYAGSSYFSIVKGELTDDVDPIECSLQNMKVEVDVVDETGKGLVGSDVKVVVKAGKNGVLTYDSEHKDSKGYFKFDENSNTIAAELSGTIDGKFTNDIARTYQDAGPGKAYRIRFLINRPDNVGYGDIQIGDGITVDATISIKNENFEPINPGEPDDEEFIDNMRPTEEIPDDPSKDPGIDPGTDPGKDPDNDPGNNPNTGGNPPQINIDPECKELGLNLGEPFTVGSDSKCKFSVHSDSANGFIKFEIVIISSTLDADELAGVGLSDHLDLVNPGEFEEVLAGLKLPVNVGGNQDCTCDITEFLGLLGALGSGTHEFQLTIEDEYGRTIGSLILVTE